MLAASGGGTLSEALSLSNKKIPVPEMGHLPMSCWLGRPQNPHNDKAIVNAIGYRLELGNETSSLQTLYIHWLQDTEIRVGLN